MIITILKKVWNEESTNICPLFVKNYFKQNGGMKKLFLLLLLFAIACNKEQPQDGVIVPEVDSTTPIVVAPETGNGTGTVTPSTWTEEFMILVNDHRRSLGLRALIHNDEVGEIARKHSQNMATGSVSFGHTGFSGRCSDARDALGGGNLCAENVATGQKTPEAAFNSWMSSSGHRANIEQVRATHTGFGYAKNLSGKYYWTQIFIEL